MSFRATVKSVFDSKELKYLGYTKPSIYNGFNSHSSYYLKYQMPVHVKYSYKYKTNLTQCSKPNSIFQTNKTKDAALSDNSARFNILHKTVGLTKSLVDRTMLYVEKISYMNDVRRAQEDSIAVNDALQKSSERKRKILRELNSIQTNLYKVHEELFKSSRGTDRYVQLVQSERELLNQECDLKNEFSEADENESQLLRRLTTAINNSYQKEKIHSNFLKVWALVGTLIASVFTLIGSYVAYYNHTSKFGLFSSDIKQYVTETFKSEIGTMNSHLLEQFNKVISKQNEILKSQLKQKEQAESWGAYLNRHSKNAYRWVLRKSD